MSDSGGFGAPPPPPPPPSAGGGGQIPQRGIGDIISTAFNIYKVNATNLVKIVAVIVVPLALLQALIVRVVFKPCDPGDIETINDLGEFVDRCAGGWGRSFLLSAIAYLIAVAVQQLLTGALIHGGAAALLGRTVDANASYRYALSRLGGLIALALLVGLIVGLGFALLIIPGIIFGVFLAMVVPAFVVERRGVGESISRSWSLVSGSWWHVLGTTLVASVVAGLVFTVLTALAGNNFFLYWIFSSVALIVTAPFVALVTVVLYVDLRVRTESLSASQLGDELDTATS